MTLTEQLKKGKLKKGKYYVKTQEDNICELMFDDEGQWYDFGWDCWLGDDYVKEVLAPVPSYEEWQEEQKSLKVLAEEYCKEKEENQQLKEQIKVLKEAIYDLDGLECPKCGNYHRRGWTCSQCDYGK